MSFTQHTAACLLIFPQVKSNRKQRWFIAIENESEIFYRSHPFKKFNSLTPMCFNIVGHFHIFRAEKQVRETVRCVANSHVNKMNNVRNINAPTQRKGMKSSSYKPSLLLVVPEIKGIMLLSLFLLKMTRKPRSKKTYLNM